jgi:hypothetical protein
MAMAHMKSSGRYTGGFEPYGFRCVGGLLQVVPEEMATVTLIQRLRKEGVSLRGIGKRLSESGITTRTGKPFLPVQIARILKGSPPGMDGCPLPSERLPAPFTADGEAHARI